MEEQYITEDFGTAVALICVSRNFLGINRNSLNPQKVFFVFKKDKKLEKAIEDYYQHKLQVDALQYWMESRNLKNLLFSHKEKHD